MKKMNKSKVGGGTEFGISAIIGFFDAATARKSCS